MEAKAASDAAKATYDAANTSSGSSVGWIIGGVVVVGGALGVFFWMKKRGNENEGGDRDVFRSRVKTTNE